jgi:hypothetical protein
MSNNKTENVLVVLSFIWRLTLIFSLLAIGWCHIGCGGGNDGNCAMTDDNCRPDTDAGTGDDGSGANPDANTGSDGNNQPDGNTDVCATYQWMTNNVWDCDAGNGDPYNALLSDQSGVCYIQFTGLFWLCSASDSKCQDTLRLVITQDPPPRLSVNGDGFNVNCYQRQ